MNYEKKYKKALERAKKELDTCGSQDCDTARQIFRLFPELAESEDERIRKSLISYLHGLGEFDYPDKKTYHDWLEWLEKQDNNQHVWNDKDEKIWEELIEEVIDQLDSVPAPDCRDKEDSKVLKRLNKWLNWLKSLKQRYTWKPSKEQMKVCKEVYADLLSAKGFDVGTINSELNRLEEQLKKLREK